MNEEYHALNFKRNDKIVLQKFVGVECHGVGDKLHDTQRKYLFIQSHIFTAPLGG